MKKILVLFILLALSCSKENSLNEKNDTASKKMIVFETWDEASKQVLELSKLESDDDFLYWLSGQEHKSYLEKTLMDETMDLSIAESLTPELMALFNESLKFTVGNEIISYDNGKFYSTSKIDGSKNISDKIEIYSPITINKTVQNKLDIPVDQTAGATWKDFTRQAYRRCSDNKQILGPSSRPMRFTQQLRASRVSTEHYLYIETKLYFRNSNNDLSYAEKEERNYTYNIQGTLGFNNNWDNSYQYENINFQKTVSCTKSRWNRQLIANAPKFWGDGNWKADLTGTITHHINGDSSSNKWYAVVNWN